jgi:uncharacterized protein YcfJ
MRMVATTVAVAGSLALAACAVQRPQGPSIAALPGTGKTYEQFQQDNYHCQQVAAQATGPGPSQQESNNNSVGTAVAGTAIGAAAGALVGSTAGAVGTGAAVGAGIGLLAGSAVAADNAHATAGGLQRSYDVSYAQCMAAAGNKVPDLTAGAPVYAYPPGVYPAPAYAYPYYGPAYYGPPVGVGIEFGYGPYWRRHW